MIMKDKILFLRKRKIIIFFLLIVFLAAFLRLYKLDSVPPSLNWDEIDGGYNAYTIANWGRDEWGKFLPLIFTSFRDDKHPVHIYLTAPIVKLFGLSDFTTRLSGATVGILGVIIIFYLARILFKSDLIALLASLFLAVSPYHLHFSRGLWEMNFALFFFLLGLLMFYWALLKQDWLINISFLSFGISIISYHSSKIVVPPILLLLILLYIKDLLKLSKNFYSSLFILFLFAALLVSNPRILGIARAQQTGFSQEIIEKTQTFQKTKNHLLGLGEITFNQYLTHFTPQYLFISGDQSPRNSVKTTGEFYKIDALLILVGAFYLLILRSRVAVIIFAWILLAPLPSSLVSHAPNATRAVFMMGSMQLLAALGAGKILGWFKGKIKVFALVVILVVLSIQTYFFLKDYFGTYSAKSAIEWQYGMKQVVEFVKAHPEYNQVYMTDIRSQPYIFFLFYLKTPLPEYLDTVVYNRSETKSFSTVSIFEKYYLGGWDPIESTPSPGVLYVVSSSQYDGLRYKSSFDVKKVIYSPDNSTEFFIISAR